MDKSIHMSIWEKVQVLIFVITWMIGIGKIGFWIYEITEQRIGAFFADIITWTIVIGLTLCFWTVEKIIEKDAIYKNNFKNNYWY